MRVDDIDIKDYDYDLPLSKIAQQALEPRDSSKLLVYQNEQISDSVFKNIADYLPPDAGLFYNDAKVIPARVFVQKDSGAHIEIFLLQPALADYTTTLNATESCSWECLIGNKKKWKDDEVLNISLQADTISFNWHNKEQNIVTMRWNSGKKMADLLEEIGHMPLPPYIKRADNDHDRSRYQTVYSATSGSVAAPTAGLHFTPEVITKINNKGLHMTPLTLHVSAGTFLPVSVDKAKDHNMHREYFSVDKQLLLQLKSTPFPVAVGTTSVRVIESLYYCALNLKNGKADPFVINKLDPYSNDAALSSVEAIELLENYFEKSNSTMITGSTAIMLMPGYTFKFIKGLITNFHQPKSTLILLIAAFTGNAWRNIYNHALANNYRFLSYGDSSLLLP